MTIENRLESSESNTEEPKNVYAELLEQKRLNATEGQKNVQEFQCDKLGAAVLELMERTENNPELVNALNGFLAALEKQSRAGRSDKPLAPNRQEDLVAFLKEAGKALEWTVGPSGARPNDVEIDLSKWGAGNPE